MQDPNKGKKMGDNITDARNAAKKGASARSAEEQALVDRNNGDQQVRNNAHEAARQERIHGPAKR